MHTQPSPTSPGIGRSLAALILILPFTGCVAPFSEMQGAGMVGPGRTEITPAYSYVQWSDEGEREKVQDDFALHVATGLNQRTDLRMRYEMVKLDENVVHVLAAGPKFSVLPQRLALYTPVGFGFGSDVESSETWQFHPTLLYTMPVSPQLEVNTSAKAQIPLNAGDEDNLLAFNLGLAMGPDLAEWAIRPEVGMLINPGEDGSFWHFSLGFSRTFTSKQ